MVIKGMDKVLKNLNKEVVKIKGRTLAGLVQAAQNPIRSESQKECPVVTGNLANSAFIVASDGRQYKGGSRGFTGDDASKMASDHASSIVLHSATLKAGRSPAVAIGYSAVYAANVHENPRSGKTGGTSPSGKKYTPGLTETGRKSKRKVFSTVGKWKFLEDPIKNNTQRVLAIIARKARIKK